MTEVSGRTFEVQILGSVDILGDGLCVHLQRVYVGGVPRDDHIVPLVVVQWVVAVPLQQTRPVPQIKHVVDEPGREAADNNQSFSVDPCVCVCVCVSGSSQPHERTANKIIFMTTQ